MKLATKLIVLFLLLTTIPLAVVGYLAYDNGRRTIEQDTLNRLISTNILKEDEFERWIENNERTLRALARRPLIREYAAVLASRAEDDPEYQAAHKSILEDHLDPTLEEEGGFLELFILRDSDGLILVSTDEHNAGKYRENESYFVEGKSRTYVQNVYYSLTLEEAVMTIGVPIKDKDGNLIAVLAGHVDLAEMSEIMMQRSGLSASEETYLVNKFNFFATESRFEPGYALKKALHTEGVKACLEGSSFDTSTGLRAGLAQDRDGVGFYEDYRGVPVDRGLSLDAGAGAVHPDRGGSGRGLRAQRGLARHCPGDRRCRGPDRGPARHLLRPHHHRAGAPTGHGYRGDRPGQSGIPDRLDSQG